MMMRQVSGRAIDQKRVFAISGVMLLHVLVLAVFMLPKQPAELWKRAPPEVVISIDRVEPLAPPKPPEPILVPPPPRRFLAMPNPPAAAITAIPNAPVVSNNIVVSEVTDQPVVANAIVDDSAGDIVPGGSPQLLSLKLLYSPPPAYPRRERARGIGGSVELRVLVGTDGLPQQIEVIGGSGIRAFESAAIRAVKRWRFAPHRVNGEARSAWALVPLNFRIED